MKEKMILFVFLLIFGVINFVASKNIIKDDVNSTSSCCENSLRNHEQRHVLGYYSKISDDFQDYWNYKQNEPSSQHEKLWYNPSIQAWFIADFLGSMCI